MCILSICLRVLDYIKSTTRHLLRLSCVYSTYIFVHSSQHFPVFLFPLIMYTEICITQAHSKSALEQCHFSRYFHCVTIPWQFTPFNASFAYTIHIYMYSECLWNGTQRYHLPIYDSENLYNSHKTKFCIMLSPSCRVARPKEQWNFKILFL